MERSKTFTAEREPLRNTSTLQLNTKKVHGPVTFLNPSQAAFDAASAVETHSETGELTGIDASRPTGGQRTETFQPSSIEYRWTSRDNRKGRHTLIVRPTVEGDAICITPSPTTNLKHVLKNIGRMFTYFPIWDISYLVAVTFTWGSVIFILNGFFVLLPFTDPKSEFPKETLFGGGITAFTGVTVFEVGSVLLMLEAALEQLYEAHFHSDNCEGGIVHHVFAAKDDCLHHHQNAGNVVGRPTQHALTNLSQKLTARAATSNAILKHNHSWKWYPSWRELHAHYLHELGFLACSSLLFGMTVFCISGLTAVPPIFNQLDTKAKLNWAFWIPQVVGGVGFIISGTLFTIETQKHWWKPAPSVLGWHVGMWNLIGGIGFTLCPIFGLLGAKYWAEYQAACSTFWGSWAFLIGSLIQWFESLEKHPVEKMKAA